MSPQDEGIALLWVMAFIGVCAVGMRAWLAFGEWRRLRAARAAYDAELTARRHGSGPLGGAP
jgi:hypothetical protein